jgi:hypothetical protein
MNSYLIDQNEHGKKGPACQSGQCVETPRSISCISMPTRGTAPEEFGGGHCFSGYSVPEISLPDRENHELPSLDSGIENTFV